MPDDLEQERQRARDAVRQHLAAVGAYGHLAVDEEYGVSLGLDWFATPALNYGDVARPAGRTPVPDITAEFDWQRDTWWPATPGGRLLRALDVVDPAALTRF